MLLRWCQPLLLLAILPALSVSAPTALPKVSERAQLLSAGTPVTVDIRSADDHSHIAEASTKGQEKVAETLDYLGEEVNVRHANCRLICLL